MWVVQGMRVVHAMHTVWEHVASVASAVCRLILLVMHYVFVGVWR